MKSKPSKTIRVWDLPTRLFHIALALAVTGAIVTAKIGNAWMDWHVKLGITALALITFRVIWGFIGPRYARFSHFLCSPAKILRYFKVKPQLHDQEPGHNPLGGLSVIAMLAVLGAQAVTGLFSNDEILTQGPLAQFVSDASSSLATGLHQFNEKFVYFFIALHLVAIVFYTSKGERLIGPMIHGDVPRDAFSANAIAARDDLRVRALALLLILALACAAWWLIQLANNAGASFN